MPSLSQFAQTSKSAQLCVRYLTLAGSLLPAHFQTLENLYGKVGVNDARRLAGYVAETISLITKELPSQALLDENGFHIDTHIILPTTLLNLPTPPPVSEKLDTTLTKVYSHAQAIEASAASFIEYALPFDQEAMNTLHTNEATFSYIADSLPERPTDFPFWDGRPMFCEEENAFLTYLIHLANYHLFKAHHASLELGSWLAAHYTLTGNEFSNQAIGEYLIHALARLSSKAFYQVLSDPVNHVSWLLSQELGVTLS